MIAFLQLLSDTLLPCVLQETDATTECVLETPHLLLLQAEDWGKMLHLQGHGLWQGHRHGGDHQEYDGYSLKEGKLSLLVSWKSEDSWSNENLYDAFMKYSVSRNPCLFLQVELNSDSFCQAQPNHSSAGLSSFFFTKLPTPTPTPPNLTNLT